MTKDWYIFAFIYRFLFYFGYLVALPMSWQKEKSDLSLHSCGQKTPKHTDEMFKMLWTKTKWMYRKSFYNFSYKLTRLIIYGISVTGSWHHEGVENTEEFQKIYTTTTLNEKVKRRKSLSAWTPEEKHSSIDVSDVTYMWFVVKP